MKGGKNEMFTIFKKALSIDAKNKGGDTEAHEIKYGEWYDTNNNLSSQANIHKFTYLCTIKKRGMHKV